MVDVFISYARENEDVAQRLAQAVAREGYSVWWDDDIPPHLSYGEVITEKIGDAKAAIVIWSKSAASSEWVRAEADVARSGRKLIQTSVDGTTPPLPFNLIQFAAIGDWTGEEGHPGWKAVKTSLAALCGPPVAPAARAFMVPPAPPPAPEPEQVASPPPVASTPPPPVAPASTSTIPPVSRNSSLPFVLAAAGGAAVLILGAFLLMRGVSNIPATNEIAAAGATQPQPLLQPPVQPQGNAPAPVVPPQQADPALFTRTAIVQTGGEVDVRAGPAAGFGVIGRVGGADSLATYPQTGEWWRVRTANGRVGFVRAADIRLLDPGQSLSMDGSWGVSWVAGGVPYNGAMDVHGPAAVLTVAFAGSRVRQDCAVGGEGANVEIQCRNPQFLAGKGDYAPDAFRLELSGASVIEGHIRDTANVTARATFTRR